jgi:hypothetical protein
MSLITLTFGSGSKKNINNNSNNENESGLSVSTPESRLKQKILKGVSTGTVIVRKACRFYSRDEVFILGEVTEGLVSDDMKLFAGEKELRVIDIESKYGRAAKPGMTVGITVTGIDDDELPQGSTLCFKLLSS